MKQQCFSWGKIILALVFLFNPPINLIDILPDFIGYLLLMLAIKNAAVAFPHFDEAYRGFEKMFWITLLKAPAFFLMLSVLRVSVGERSIIAVFSLAFAVLEFIFAISAFRAFFEALTHLGEREGLLPVLKAGKSRRGLDGVISLTLIFLLLKGLCSFLPELSLISVSDALASVDTAVNFARFYPLLLLMSNLFGYAFGAVWLYYATSYFRDLKRSEVMRDFSDEKASLFADTFEKNARRRMDKAALFALVLALLLAFDLVFDGKNYLPDVLSAVALVFFFLLLRRDSRFALYGVGGSVLYGVLSVLTQASLKGYLAEYTYTDVARRPEARAAYLTVELLGVFEALMLIGLLVLLFLTVRDFIRCRVGADFDQSNASLAEDLQDELTFKAKLFTAFGVLSAVFFAVEKFLLTLVERHVITDTEANQYYEAGSVLYIPVFGSSWLIGLAVTALWVCYGIYFISSLRSELYATEEK